MRLSIRITIISTILLLLCCCTMVVAQEIQVVPIATGMPQSSAMTQNPTNAVSIPATQLPLQAPTTIPSSFTGLIQQLPATPVGTPLPSTTGGPLPQAFPAPSQAPNGGLVGPPASAPQQYAEPLSPFEEYIRTGVPGALNFDISQFGYQLFRQPPSSFAPLQNIPVESTYVVGPGDEIRISVWGSFDGQWSVMVDRNGQISLPRIGTIGVTGLTFEQLKSSLINEFKKYFTDFEMNISMGQLRSILVYVVGNARKPGAYSLSSMSTLMNALFECGGPDKNGSMRDIQLKRAGRIMVHFDLYDMLLKGDKTRDMRLMPGDVIFIPTVGALVGIAGQVNQPAIYELSRTTSLSDLIKMAGGLKSMAFKGRFQIQRVVDHKFINVVEGDLAGIENYPGKNITLQDGDLAKIYGVPELKNFVSLEGAVLIPGEYGVTAGVTTVKEVIERAGGLQPFASAQAELTRLTITQEGPITTVTDFDVKLAVQNDPLNNLSLQAYDYLKIRTVPDWQLYRKVTITGEVKFPGTYATRKGERLSSLLERAGSFTDKAYLVGTIFKRERVKALEQRQILQMVDRLEMELMASGTSDISSALSSDEARIFAEETKQKRAFLDSLRKIEPQGRVVVKLETPERLKNSVYDVILEEADTVFIPSNPETVQVIGAVFNQASFVYQRGKSYSDYIYLCGGYSESADTDNVYILKTNGSAVRPGGALSWDRISHKWTYGNGQDMEPGDTVVVPQKLDRIAWLREVKDFTQVLYQIAVTAGIMFIAF